jgi:RNA polymerase sigma-70 factor (ECF subfamily)
VTTEKARDARFETLLSDYGPAIRRLCSAYVDRTDSEDLFQEIAFALWRALPNFRGDASERTWLYRIAHNVALGYARRLRSRRNVSADLVPDAAAPAPSTQHGELLDAVRRLELADKNIALLYLEGLTAEEIGSVTGMAPGTVAVRLTRLRRKLAVMLGVEQSR